MIPIAARSNGRTSGRRTFCGNPDHSRRPQRVNLYRALRELIMLHMSFFVVVVVVVEPTA